MIAGARSRGTSRSDPPISFAEAFVIGTVSVKITLRDGNGTRAWGMCLSLDKKVILHFYDC